MSGHIDVIISEDKMSAEITVATPGEVSGLKFTAADVEKALSASRVAFGIKKSVIRQVVEQAAAGGEPVKNVRVAKGIPAEKGQDAEIILKVGNAAANKDPQACHFVRAGQVIAIKNPATQGKNGKSVLGQDVPGETGRDVQFVAGENVMISADGNELRATAYGRVEVSAKTFSVSIPMQIRHDKMSAQMKIVPILSDNSMLSVTDLLSATEHEGVVSGIRKEAIEAALQPSQPIQTIRVAEGTLPEDGVPAQIDFQFLLNGESPEIVNLKRKETSLEEDDILKDVVCEGEVLAVKIPEKAPVDGCNIVGKVLPGRKAPPGPKISVGANVKLLEDGVTYVVADGVTGYANLIQDTLCVESPIRVSEDNLRVYLCIHPPSASGRQLTRAMIDDQLACLAVTYGISDKAIEKTLEKATKITKPFDGVLIAKGIPPQKGEDARIIFHFQVEKQAGRVVDATGRMDFKERGAVQNVQKDELIAEKVPASAGIEGMDVFGRTLAAEHGKDRSLRSIGNVTTSADGLKYTAEIKGMVTLSGEDKIGVFKQYEISGDVDYATGNLTMDGSLNIRGWVRSGFTIRANGDVTVGEGIEDAVVVAGANLTVRGGILGKENIRVKAGGNISAGFMENARVNAGGDIFVKDATVRSVVSAEGYIDVTAGKGQIMGGEVSAVKGVSANMIGAESGVKTTIKCGDFSEVHSLAMQEKKRRAFLERNKSKINAKIARILTKRKMGALTTEENDTFLKLIKLKREIGKIGMKQTEKKRRRATASSKAASEPLTVHVKRAVYEGTTVIIDGYPILMKQDIIEGGTFVLNPEELIIEYVS